MEMNARLSADLYVNSATGSPGGGGGRPPAARWHHRTKMAPTLSGPAAAVIRCIRTYMCGWVGLWERVCVYLYVYVYVHVYADSDVYVYVYVYIYRCIVESHIIQLAPLHARPHR